MTKGIIKRPAGTDGKAILGSEELAAINNLEKVAMKDLDEDKITKLEIPTGNPLFISFNDKNEITKCHYLDLERAKDLIAF